MVAGGYRPPKPKKMDDELFSLIEWCWRQEPEQRPKMSVVLKSLQGMRQKLAAAMKSDESCSIS